MRKQNLIGLFLMIGGALFWVGIVITILLVGCAIPYCNSKKHQDLIETIVWRVNASEERLNEIHIRIIRYQNPVTGEYIYEAVLPAIGFRADGINGVFIDRHILTRRDNK